jgi:hypothetical protein
MKWLDWTLPLHNQIGGKPKRQIVISIGVTVKMRHSGSIDLGMAEVRSCPVLCGEA